MKKRYPLLIAVLFILTGCRDISPDRLSESPSDALQETTAETEAAEGAASRELSAASATDAASVAAAILTEDMSDYERVKAIHDYLVTYVDYDYENLAAGTLPDEAFTAEGAFENHLAVCEGYAQAFSLLCAEAGLTELLVYGEADDGTGSVSHAWNQVLLDGEWYNVDVTWDDPLVNGEVVTDGSNRIYDYFLVPDSTLEATHTPDPDAERHVCTSPRFLTENRRLTIEPSLQEPYTFADTDAASKIAIEHYLSEQTLIFQIVFDVKNTDPEAKGELVLSQTEAAMKEYALAGQISIETQYGVADYAIVSVEITLR